MHFKDLLFVLAAGEEGKDADLEPIWPAAFGLTNALVVAAAAPNAATRTADVLVTLASEPAAEPALPPRAALAAVLTADALAACWPRLLETHKGEGLKQAFLAAATANPASNPSTPVLQPCPRDPARSPKR